MRRAAGWLAPVAVVGVVGCMDYGIGHLVNASKGTDETGMPAGEGYYTGSSTPCGGTDSLATSVTFDESCATDVVTGELDAVVEWSLATFASGYGEYGEVLMAPVVGQLTDDDGDGDIDRDDVPDIALVSDDGGAASNHAGILRVVPGDGLGANASIGFLDWEGATVMPYRYGNLALGDVDGDGAPEIVFIALVVGGDDGGDDTGDGPPGTDTAPPGGGDTGGDTGGGGDDDHPVRRSGTVDWSALPVDGDVPVDLGETCTVAALDPVAEQVEWVAGDLAFDCAGHAPALADLEGDGLVEVIVGPAIVAGADGALRAVGRGGQGRYYAYPEIGMHAFAADLDGDGVQELVAGHTLYDPDAQPICQAEGVHDGFGAAADLDGDGEGEVVVVGAGEVAVYGADCAVAARWSLSGGGNGGPPTIADFDGDGEPEIGIADATTYAVYEPDGTVDWTAPVTDASSHATGSSVFDFEGDGRPEVVYADETRLWVFDGLTGEVRLEDAGHASRTLHEYPTVADVDGDGQAEIVVPNGGGHQGEDRTGVYVLGSASGSWLSARQVWNQHAYAITNIDDDLAVPVLPDPNWPTHNNFRSGDPHPASGGAAPDAVPLAELCEIDCGRGVHVLTVRLGNAGASAIRDGVPVSVYTGRDADVLLATDWWSEVVEPGGVSGPLRFEIPDEDVVHDVLTVVVDDEAGVGWVRECREDDNALVLDDVECP